MGMPSSTSSSNDRLPRGRWALTWAVALVVAGTIIGGWETVLRVHGLGVASVDDGPELWAQERERAARLGKDAIVLVGASEMQMGIDIDTMRKYTTGTPVQLAISAAPFMPLFEDLADDERITGTVVVSFSMSSFCSTASDSISEKWVRHYARLRASRAQLFYERVENALRRAVSAALVSVGRGARPQQLLRREPTSYVRTLPDRSQHADYQIVDREAAYRHRVAVYLDGEEPSLRAVPDLDARLSALEAMIRKITNRGGRVILVRFPTTKRIWEIDEIMYPRDVYWSALARRTSARTIHFADYASLSGFDLPDGVHIDYRDAPAFTAALSALLFEPAESQLAPVSLATWIERR
jgi:hypothetical protein